jgi:hypothetical protein
MQSNTDSPLISSAMRPTSRASWWRTAAAVLATLYMLALAVYVAQRPSYAWDMIAYMAIALRDAGTPVARIHDEAYAALDASLPQDQLDELRGRGSVDPEFRQAVAADSDSFQAQLPFFSVKPVYPALMAVLHGAGLGLIASGLAVSAAAYFGIGMLLYVWFARWMTPFVAFGIMALMVLDPFLVVLARNVGPDMLSIFLLLLGAYLAIERDRPLACALVFIGSIAVRPENVLYAGIFILYLGLFGKLTPARTVLCLAAAGAFCLGLTQFTAHYGWKTQFYYTFVKKSAAAGEAPPPMGLLDYAKMYFNRLDRIVFGQDELPVFALVGFGALCLKARFEPIRDRYVHLVVIAGVLAVARMIILPAEAFRALLPSYIYVTIALVHACIQSQARATTNVRTDFPVAKRSD